VDTGELLSGGVSAASEQRDESVYLHFAWH
jgi:hypothetical protein